jgi:hypothetical protein
VRRRRKCVDESLDLGAAVAAALDDDLLTSGCGLFCAAAGAAKAKAAVTTKLRRRKDILPLSAAG